MGTASLHLFGIPPMMKVMGNYNANRMGTTGNQLWQTKKS